MKAKAREEGHIGDPLGIMNDLDFVEAAKFEVEAHNTLIQKHRAEAAKQRRWNAALGLDNDDWIIGETQVSKPLNSPLVEAERFEAEHFDTLLRKRRKEIEELEAFQRHLTIRNRLHELKLVVLHTPTTADQLERDIRESYVTTAWYLLKEEEEVE